MNSISTVRGSRNLWRIVSLLLVASMLFGLGALGTAAGTGARTPGVDPVSTTPRTSDDATGSAETPEAPFERSSAAEVTDGETAVGRLAEEVVEDTAPDDDTSQLFPFDPHHPTITRSTDAGPRTIGETITVDITVTIPASGTVHWAKIRDDLSRHGAEYVRGSTTLTNVSGTPVQAAALTKANPNVKETNDGARFVWKLEEPIEAGAEDYVFKLSYVYQYTAVKPANDKQEMWLPTDHQGVRGTATVLFWNENAGGAAPAERDTNDSSQSAESKTDIDQPLLSLYKSAGGNSATFWPGWWISFKTSIHNDGWSTAHDIKWSDRLPDQLGDPMFLGAIKSTPDLSNGTAIAGGPTVDADISDQVTADFTTDKPTIKFNDVSLAPQGEWITVYYLAWVEPGSISIPGSLNGVLAPPLEIKNKADVDWSTLPGKISGERRYKDQDWEHQDGSSWKKDTDKAAITIASDLPSLALYKDVAEGTPPMMVVGDTVTYDITVMNSGPVTATVVPIRDMWYSDELEFISATIAPDYQGTELEAGFMDWNDLSAGAGLAPGGRLQVSTTFKLVGGGNAIQNRAFIDWEEYYLTLAEQPASETKSIMELTDAWVAQPFQGNVAIAEIAVVDPAETTFVKSADPVEGTIVLPGEAITYTISGTSDVTSFNALITDTLDDSVEYVPGSIRVRAGSYEATITDDPYDDMGGYDAGTRTVWLYYPWVPTETPGELLFDVVVRDAEFSKQGVQNTAEAYAITIPDGNGEDLNGLSDLPTEPPVEAEADPLFIRNSNTVYHPVDPFVIEKVGEDVNGGLLIPGDEILWTITVTNTGFTPTTNVVVYDTVPEHTTYKAGSITGLGADDSADPDLVWNVGSMPVGGVEECTFISTVDMDTPSGTTISNQAAVESDESFLAFSDSPTTSEVGDATLLQTGQNDWVWIALVIAMAGLGTAMALGGRSRAKRDAS